MRLLVTRPAQDARRTAAALGARGHAVVLAPMLTIEPVLDDVLGAGPWDGLLFTSVNAVRAIETNPRFKALQRGPVFAVGRRTADAAKAAGFAEITSADGDEAAMVTLLRARFAGQSARFLYLAAEDRAGDLAGDLRACGFAVETAVIYRAVPAGRLGVEAEAALAEGRIDGVLHYSQRTAAAFLAAAERAGLSEPALALRHFCLSPQVAAPLQAAGAPRVSIAERPDERALFALIGP